MQTEWVIWISISFLFRFIKLFNFHKFSTLCPVAVDSNAFHVGKHLMKLSTTRFQFSVPTFLLLMKNLSTFSFNVHPMLLPPLHPTTMLPKAITFPFSVSLPVDVIKSYCNVGWKDPLASLFFIFSKGNYLKAEADKIKTILQAIGSLWCCYIFNVMMLMKMYNPWLLVFLLCILNPVVLDVICHVQKLFAPRFVWF